MSNEITNEINSTRHVGASAANSQEQASTREVNKIESASVHEGVKDSVLGNVTMSDFKNTLGSMLNQSSHLPEANINKEDGTIDFSAARENARTLPRAGKVDADMPPNLDVEKTEALNKKGGTIDFSAAREKATTLPRAGKVDADMPPNLDVEKTDAVNKTTLLINDGPKKSDTGFRVSRSMRLNDGEQAGPNKLEEGGHSARPNVLKPGDQAERPRQLEPRVNPPAREIPPANNVPWGQGSRHMFQGPAKREYPLPRGGRDYR